ncbi:uncharacterized protein EURHEDRAFT_280311 [Aspergillus ruber CBS 135680]|uniref:Uncharacterized protein n=1 Tax=Aspergillus ruber (strain CBS 135680) TaxID=1388766 RepID=A0A017S1Y7_ASPRC|nr:uncharacterized protein EURHEDRAFT_280311 [Aspergillus ruber CBS 135680]EYE90861.1 hypothetical protein EURHEDRAFT_280311 [Aspergillus ruber CBS 135680]
MAGEPRRQVGNEHVPDCTRSCTEYSRERNTSPYKEIGPVTGVDGNNNNYTAFNMTGSEFSWWTVDCGLWTGVWRWTDIQGMGNIIAWRVWGLGMCCVVHKFIVSFLVLVQNRVVSICIRVIALRIRLRTYILCTRYNNQIIMTQCLF